MPKNSNSGRAAAEEFISYLKPGKRVWLKVEEPDKSGKSNLVVRGVGENPVTYQGWQVLGTETFLVIDEVLGEGRKAQLQTFMINTRYIRYMGTEENSD